MSENRRKSFLTKRALQVLEALISHAWKVRAENGYEVEDEIPVHDIESYDFTREDVRALLRHASRSQSEETLERVLGQLIEAGLLEVRQERSGTQGRPRNFYHLSLSDTGEQRWRHIHKVYDETLLPEKVLGLLGQLHPMKVARIPGKSQIGRIYPSTVLTYAFEDLHKGVWIDTDEFRAAGAEVVKRFDRGMRLVAGAVADLPFMVGNGVALVIFPELSLDTNPLIEAKFRKERAEYEARGVGVGRFAIRSRKHAASGN
jgi:hypothetical protein